MKKSKNKKLKKIAIKKGITSEEAWNEYVDVQEKIFISNFVAEGLKDINKMCKFYCQELPLTSEFDGYLFSQKQIELIEGLITKHLQRYVKEKGGFDNMELYSEKELDDMLIEDHEKIMDYLCNRFNVEREVLSELMSERVRNKFPDLLPPKNPGKRDKRR